jgi:hypothetical protein
MSDIYVDILTDRQMGRQTDGQMERWTYRLMDVQKDSIVRRRTDGETDKLADGQTDRLMVRRTGRWTDKLIDGQTNW